MSLGTNVLGITFHFLVPSEETTLGVIFTGNDSVLQDQPAVLVMLVCLAARGLYVPCRLGTGTGEELNVLHCLHLVCEQDDGEEELA